ncbi:MAG: type transport system permease protein [Solirubrobacteraceae bacterium]|jgi:ABC-2 type transport system permease protein|nr:type transport system permease protein [Solirubrobacteraceae bacterium]MEA2137996.1 type transport system permease protein [Solirubrobacteraceae bacterium]
MRWLLLKDLQILWRSKLLLGLLIFYPIAIATLMGFALSSGPEKPRVAFLNQVPENRGTIRLGNQKLDIKTYTKTLFTEIDQVPVSNRDEALKKVRSGAVLAALIIPPDFTQKLSQSGFSGASVEVVYNGDALKQSFVRTTISSKLAQADSALAKEVNKLGSGYIDVILRGGKLDILGTQLKLFGLQRSKTAIDKVMADSPSRATKRRLGPVQSFAELAVANAGRAKDLLDTVEKPVVVKETVLSGRRTPLDTFAVAVAVTISLMFVCVLLASGLLALEREENTFARLARGLVPGGQLIAEKIVLSAACAFAVSLAMLIGVSAFVPLEWGRVGLWVLALAGGALAFAALGVAIGSLAREVRAASLLAFLLSLPLAFLALVPSGGVSPLLYDVIQVISAIFPFKASLDAVNAAVNGASPGVGVSLAHLAVLIAAFGAAARLGLRRFA